MTIVASLIGTGVTLGVVHVLTGPDHLSAIATLSSTVASDARRRRGGRDHDHSSDHPDDDDDNDGDDDNVSLVEHPPPSRQHQPDSTQMHEITNNVTIDNAMATSAPNWINRYGSEQEHQPPHLHLHLQPQPPAAGAQTASHEHLHVHRLFPFHRHHDHGHPRTDTRHRHNHQYPIPIAASSINMSASVPRQDFWLGVQWGVGHSTGLLLVGIVLILIDHRGQEFIQMPDQVGHFFESLVGLFMIALGLYGIRRAWYKLPKNYRSFLWRIRHSNNTASTTIAAPHPQHQQLTQPQQLDHPQHRNTNENSPTQQPRLPLTPIQQSGLGCHGDSSHLSPQQPEPAALSLQALESCSSPSSSSLSFTGSYQNPVQTLDNNGVRIESTRQISSESPNTSSQHENPIDPATSICSSCGRNCLNRVSTRTLALLAGMVHGLAGPGGVLGVIPAVQLHNVRLACLYLTTFCISSTITMGTFAAVYGTCSSTVGAKQVQREFWMEISSACLSLLVGILWIVLLSIGKLDDVFP